MFSHTGVGGFYCQGGSGRCARRISKGIAASRLLEHSGKRPSAWAIAYTRGKKDCDARARTPEIHRTLVSPTGEKLGSLVLTRLAGNWLNKHTERLSNADTKIHIE
jgi:hypothetical protein